MTTVRHRSLTERLEAATAACSDTQDLARAVFHVVRRDVAFVFGCLATSDPASGLITGAYKSHPLPMGDEDFAAAEYGEPDVNQFAEVARRPVPVAVLSVDTAGDVGQCRRMRDYMGPTFGFTDEIRLACRAQDTTWGYLAIYRGAGEAAFTRQDGDRLGQIHELLARRLRHALFATVGVADPPHAAAVLIVDSADRVCDVTAAADDQIDELGGWDNGSLPANVLAVAARSRANGQPAESRVRGVSGHWLAVRAMPLGEQPAQRSTVITIDSAPSASVGQLALAARGLTGREQDVARLVLQGASTKTIASSLHLSPHTVQDHLKAVFDKLGVTSRREMIAQLVLTDAG